jgi:hypothetical protein
MNKMDSPFTSSAHIRVTATDAMTIATCKGIKGNASRGRILWHAAIEGVLKLKGPICSNPI